MVRTKVEHTYTARQKFFLRFLKENDELRDFIKVVNEQLLFAHPEFKHLHPINKILLPYDLNIVIDFYYSHDSNKRYKCLTYIRQQMDKKYGRITVPLSNLYHTNHY